MKIPLPRDDATGLTIQAPGTYNECGLGFFLSVAMSFKSRLITCL